MSAAIATGQAPRAADVAPAVEVTLGPGWGWTTWRTADATVSFKGWLLDGGRSLEGEQAAAYAARVVGAVPDDGKLKSALAQLAGHFALVVRTPGRLVACVDRIRSCPLMWAHAGGTTFIDDRGRRLRDKLGLGPDDVDAEQALACATGGWTVGSATLYRGLHMLRAGEALVVDAAGPRTLRWFIYDAWNTEPLERPEQRLSELHRGMIERLAASADGRPICVPLSAGLDSRMIAAGLRAVGYRDVRLFSYGRPGNHEAQTARQIAERLGYSWIFVTFTGAMQRAMLADPAHERALWEEADTCGCFPFEQDWLAISALKKSGWISPDAVIVNGQSGDFITGNHVPSALIDGAAASASESRDRVYAAYIGKHHSLWRALSGAAVRRRIGALLDDEVAAVGADFDRDAPHGIYEFLEGQDRQSKYVVSGQRTYEALDLKWRLPLWDDDYMLFWRRVPLELKVRQNLYRRVLESDNWGDVWRDVPVNAKTIRPRWIVPLRFAAKLAVAPFGRDRWHRAERRLFGWWMDPLRVSAMFPYRQALAENRGPRHAGAWIVERYLARHGVDVDEFVREVRGARQ